MSGLPTAAEAPFRADGGPALAVSLRPPGGPAGLAPAELWWTTPLARWPAGGAAEATGKSPAGDWRWQVATAPRPGGGWTIAVTIERLGPTSSPVCVDVALWLPGWSPATGYTLAPAMVYGGNALDIVDVPYSPFWPGPEHLRPDRRPTMTRQPQLDPAGGTSALEVDSTGLASPWLAARLGDGAAWWLEVPRQTDGDGSPLGLTLSHCLLNG